MTPLPFGPFEPDRAKYAVQATTNAVNVLPIQDGWGPMPSLNVVSDALAAAPLGSIMVRTSNGSFVVYAGTATKLYKLDTSTGPYSWTDVSRVSGGDYGVPSGNRWSFALFGINLVAVNSADAPQFIDVDSGTNFAAISGSPPQAKYVWTAGDHLVLGNTANSPNQVYWSGINSLTQWTLGSRGCGEQTFTDGNEVQGGIRAQNGAYIFQRDMIRSMTRSGDAASAFRTDVINPSAGAISPLSIVNVSANNFAWLSEKGFFMGLEARPIGFEKVDRWFLNGSEVDRDFLPEVRGMLDPYNKIVWFQYQKQDATKKIIGYNYYLEQWCYLDQDITEISAMATAAVTIDGLDNLYASIDDVTAAFDSRLLQGGRPTLNGWNSDNKLGVFSGSNLEAVVETADVQFGTGLTTPHEMRAVTDATGYTVKQKISAFHGGTRTAGGAVSPHSRTGICHFTKASLLHSFELTIPAGTNWNHVTAIAPVRVEQDGEA